MVKIASSFDAGADGWTMTGDPSSVTWQTSGGNPGGFMHWVDGASGQDSYWVAPAKFRGSQAAFLGGTLSYDIEDTGNGYSGVPDVILTGGGLTLVAAIGQAGTDWTHYSIKLDDTGGWKVSSLTGAAATDAQIGQVLGNLLNFQIRAEFVNGGKSGGLDNVTLSSSAAAPRSDFNADLKSDILMTNPTTGQLLIWEMDGTTRLAASGKTSSAPGTNYTIIGTGDFNGDGKADILMQDQSTGHTTIWEMDGTTRLASSGQAGSNQGAAYKALGAADFNGDGKADIVWENTTTGQVSVWLMNGTTKLSGANVGAALSSDWTFAGTGDFDGDGKADIVFQNATTGAVKIWLMDGTTKVGGGTLAGTSGTGHEIVGIGDFDGDGKSDLLWETTSSTALSIWFMDGMTRTSHASIGDAVAGHVVVGTGDYNGDGMADILLQTTSSGHLTEWLMDGSTKLSGSGSVSSNPGTSWHVVAG